MLHPWLITDFELLPNDFRKLPSLEEFTGKGGWQSRSPAVASLPFIEVSRVPLSGISPRGIRFTNKVGHFPRSNLNRALTRFNGRTLIKVIRNMLTQVK